MRLVLVLMAILATQVGFITVAFAQSAPAPSEAAIADPLASFRPSAANMHYLVGRQMLMRGSNAQAVEAFTLALATAPGWAAAYADRGVAHMRQGAFTPAIEDLSKAQIGRAHV